jgi:hypothetical protein
MGSLRRSSTNLNLDTRWTWVVSFTPQPRYPSVNRPWYPLYMGLDPRACLEAMETRISLEPARNRTLDRLAPLIYRLSNPFSHGMYGYIHICIMVCVNVYVCMYLCSGLLKNIFIFFKSLAGAHQQEMNSNSCSELEPEPTAVIW